MSGAPVYVSIAPSFIANYDGAGIEDIDRAVKKLGFAGAEETAVGAAIVKKEYDRMLSDGTRDILISSCCHSVNLLIQKYFPRALPYLADVVSPMQAHALHLKKEHPGARVVFVGPCVAKRTRLPFTRALWMPFSRLKSYPIGCKAVRLILKHLLKEAPKRAERAGFRRREAF